MWECCAVFMPRHLLKYSAWQFLRRIFFFFFLKRSYLSHVFPIEIASANLFPQLLLPGSSLWWVDSGEVLCNLMHRCVSQNKMSRERGREEGRGRKRRRGGVCGSITPWHPESQEWPAMKWLLSWSRCHITLGSIWDYRTYGCTHKI